VYYYNPADWSPSTWLRKLRFWEDWGDARVTLRPAGDTCGRSGFFLHGGVISGSAGCIDVGWAITVIWVLTRQHEEQIPVIVDYSIRR
jgi:hypothetical protein